MNMSHFRLSLLGPFQAVIHDRPMSAFATDKARALLVYLALEAGIPHRRESLAALLYPDWSDSEALNNLRKTLFRLRSALDAHAPKLSDALLTITRPTIELNPSALWLDVVEFRQTVLHTLNKGRFNEEDLEALGRAVLLYRGELAAGLSLADAQPFEEWLVLQREAIHQQVLHLTDVLATAYERRGAFGQAQIYARRALALEPWREEAHLQLIRLLALNGQRSEALAQYESCRRLLDAELGVEPNEAIESLMEQIQKGMLVAPSIEATLLPRTLLHRFPAQFTSFVGREEEIETVLRQLRLPEYRLITIVGTGGVGKTRLSVQVAQRLAQLEVVEFRDGLYFVEVASLTKVEEVPSAIAVALGLPLQGTVPPLQQVQNFLREKAVLLVVDNVEQIIACGSLLADILGECPFVKLIVTSREPLNIRAEWRYMLEGLALEGGVESKAFQLFVQRGRQVSPSLVITKQEEQAIIEIATLVEGSPLALEIAATWLRFYDCTTIAKEITKGVDFLETEMRDVPDRHRSIRALFDHSWQFLTAREQKTLRQLSVLRGEWTLPQALAVSQGTPREIVSLGDKSLLRRTKIGRYTIHELLRQFAYSKLEMSDELETTQARHAHFFLTTWAGYRNELFGMDPRHAVAMIREDWSNIRSAWAFAVMLEKWDLLLAVADIYMMVVELMGVVVEAISDFVLVVSACKGVLSAQVLYGSALVNLGWLYYRRTEYDKVDEYIEMALAGIPDEISFYRWRGQAWYVRGMMQFVTGLTEQSEVASTHAVAYFDESGNLFWQAHGVSLRGQILWKKGDFEASMACFQQALVQFQEIQYPLGITAQMTYMGVIHRTWGNYKEALAGYRECVAIAERLNAPADVARQYNNIGTVFYYLEEYQQAIDYYSRALEIDSGLGHLRGASMEKGNIGLVYQQLYDYERALHYWDEAVKMAQVAGLKGVEANYQCSRGVLYSELGNFDQARHELETGIALARSIDNRPIVANYSGNLAWVYFRLGKAAEAMVTIDESAAVQARFGMRQKLAETLYRKALLLIEQEDKGEALNCLEQSVELWDELKSQEANVFRAKSALLWLESEVRGDATEVVLNDLLENAKQDEGRAEVLFALWKVTQKEQYRSEAQMVYQALLDRANLYEFRMRLAELNK
jgi:predicted ATPase/DNA-binding SARP family transcriptional activator